MARRLLYVRGMQELDSAQLAAVVGGESFTQVLKALPAATNLPVSQTYTGTIDFIRDHPFFHQGVMNWPIGSGKHFRNVAFIGPYYEAKGKLTGNATDVARGREITRATHDAD